MIYGFGGPYWVGVGHKGRCGKARHLYVDPKGMIRTYQTPDSVHLCQVEINPDSLIGPIKMHRGSDIDTDAREPLIRQRRRIITNAKEYGIDHLAPQLSSLIWTLEEKPAELICGDAALIVLDKRKMVYERLPGGYSLHVVGEKPHALMTLGKGGVSMFVASPSSYDGFDADELLRSRFRKFARYVKAELLSEGSIV